MSNTIYGNIITSGNYNMRCYCIYNDAVVGDTEVSIEILEVGFKRGGNSLSLNMANCYCTSNADDYTEVKKTTSGTWSTTTGTRAVITDDRTFTWERTNVEQTKTVTLTSVKPSGTLAGTSTITIEVVIPSVGPPPPPEPDPEWIEPVTNRTIGSRTNYNDMNRITNNLLFMGVRANKIIYSDGDFVTDKEWKRIVDICKLADGTITQSTSYTNLNKIEAAIEHIPQYLRFKAVDATDISFNIVGTLADEPTIYYSTDYLTWDEYTFGDAISLDEGERCYFKGDNDYFSTSIPNTYINFSSSGRVQADGNVMSLLDSTCNSVTIPSVHEGVFAMLFYQCDKLLTAPKLPATNLQNDCYGFMFSNCTALEIPPELPATVLNSDCYNNMFDRCTSLTTLPKINATTIGNRACSSMFEKCGNIKLSKTQTSGYEYAYRIPTSGTATVGDRSFGDMFELTGGTFPDYGEEFEANTTYYTNNEPI